jgi:uncharacterized protein (DUF885 family)
VYSIYRWFEVIMLRCGILFIALLCAITFAGTCYAQSSAPSGSWNALADDYIDQAVFALNPSAATAAGVHAYDAQLEDFSHSGIDKQLAILKEFEQRTLAFDPKTLSPMDSADREMLLGAIRGSLLSLETIRIWEKDPDSYSSGAANSVYVIMNRRFAPPDERLRSVVAREKQLPRYFADARANLKNVPRVYTEIALEQLPGTISFFEKDVPSAFANASDPATKEAFARSNAAAVAILRDYEKWLKTDLLPRSNGDFRVGAEAFSKKLFYEEMVSTPLDRLLEIGVADLHKNQGEFQRVAHEIDPARPATAVLAQLQTMHPAPNQLMQTFRNTFDGLIDFIKSHQIITLPSDRRPTLQETPPFERATTAASMDTPGVFEKVATEAYFNVTLPGPNDSPRDVAGLMAGFNVGTIISTSIHEAFPGHFTQYLWENRAPTKLRKVLSASTDIEGWAHYTEQMMLDEGYGRTPGVPEEKDTSFLKLRLGQLQDALLRNARFIVGIKMHTGQMTFDQAVDFFEKEGFQSHANALRETKRGTSDPTYLVYTLGKLEILKLRDDYKKKAGDKFSLEDFHNKFLEQGFPPVKIIRQSLLGDNSPTL